MQFVDDDVSKWYVRLSRARFYDVDGADNRAAFATLHEVLTVTSRLLAPFAPFISDWLHRALTGTSVHLASFVRGERRDATTRWRRRWPAIRDARRLWAMRRATWPTCGCDSRCRCCSAWCRATRRALEPLAPLLATELNVKQVEFVTSTDALVSLEAKANFRVLGKKFGGDHARRWRRRSATLEDAALRVLAGGGDVQVSVEGEDRG